MPRWTILMCAIFACAMLAAVDARAADQAMAYPGARRAARQLPPGLPRAHYRARTTIVYGAPPPIVVVREDDALISFPTTPLLPGSSTLPGYYGRAFDYNYQGPYYGGGGYLPYFFREPYACGVTGYC
jgi:hypothetical protein